MGLLWLEKKNLQATVQDRVSAMLAMSGTSIIDPPPASAVPMLVFPRRVEHAFDVAVQRPHDTDARANIGGPSCSARSNSACIAACHSSASCSALGSSVMYSAASRSVTHGFRPSDRKTVDPTTPTLPVTRTGASRAVDANHVRDYRRCRGKSGSGSDIVKPTRLTPHVWSGRALQVDSSSWR